MGYISKQLLKKAYNTLSGLTEDHKQGQTQIVSALRYIVALDMFYKEKERSCNLDSSIDRDDFTSNVRFVVNVCNNYYTANFYTTIEDIADCRVGSNFFSQSVVAKSKTNTEITLDYPTRGSFPLFKVKNNNLFFENNYLGNVSNYLPNDLLKTAFVIWLLRNEAINDLSLVEVQETLLTILSSDLIQQILPKEEVFKHYVEEFTLDDEKPPISPSDFLQMFDAKLNEQPQTKKTSNTLKEELKKLPIQQIFYGAPGTGKSHEVKRLTKGERVVRTTFHPDSDYATFVGAYKPTMEESDIHVVPVVVNNGISLQNKGSFKEKRIVYRFVMQAFLKAYLSAWKKYADANSTNVQSLTFNASNAIYTITGVDDNRVSYNKRFQFPVTPSKMGAAWKAVWEKGTFVIPTGPMPGKSIELALSKWIHDNIENCTRESLEQGLESFKQMVRETGTVVISIGSSGSQDYAFTASEDGDTFFVSTNAGSTIPLLKDYYSGVKDMDEATDIVRKICEMLYELDSNSFENALNRMKDVVNTNEETDDAENKDIEPEPQFLVIEEINRGNCAQIFGDLFQLLDRGCNGFSEYPIDADTDLQKEIEKAFKEHKDYKLENDIQVDGVVDGYESNYGATLSEDIQHGRVLLLPSNLYIWATMNTSDQSLFPIDSAFKRRWDWKFMNIKNEGKEWKIDVKAKDANGVEDFVNWWDFIRKVNDIIASMTSSADKQLGYFFCKADKKTIEGKSENDLFSIDTFVSKVLFYLWNDVFKDYGFEDASLFQYTIIEDGKERKRDLTFPDFYKQDSNDVDPNRVTDFVQKVMSWKKRAEENQ